MNLLEAMERRHSVRAYRDEPIPAQLREKLDEYVRELNRESGLHISIQYDDPAGFDTRFTHYGFFKNVRNYIVLAGKKDGDFDFRCGYYGEKLVLFAQTLGLNTCWTALTFNKKRVKSLIPGGESLCMAIALGLGENEGRPHRSKSENQVHDVEGDVPDWFRAGLRAALLAPTAVNQQKFCFGLENGEPTVRVKGLGSCTRVDLGIAALHFELGSGKTVRPK
jgi:hypothetical protein